jgi:hypothetical protein
MIKNQTRNSIISNLNLFGFFFLFFNLNLISSDAENVFKSSADSVVKITTYNQLKRVIKKGSGVVLGKSRSISQNLSANTVNPERIDFIKSNADGDDIISNYHVVAFASEIIVESKTGKRLKAGIVYFNSANDIAIIRTVSSLGVGTSKIAPNLNIGQKVYAIGNPSSLDWSISDGIISGFRTNNGSELIQFTAPISPGSSGGGLFDSNANLIGITTSQIKSAQNLNFAINLSSQSNFEHEVIRKSGLVIPSELDYREWAIGYFTLNDQKIINPKYDRYKNTNFVTWFKYEDAIILMSKSNENGYLEKEFGFFTEANNFKVFSDAQKFLEIARSYYFEYDIKGFLRRKINDGDIMKEYERLKSNFGDVLCIEYLTLLDRYRINLKTDSDIVEFQNEMLNKISNIPNKSNDSELNTLVQYLQMLSLRDKRFKKLESFLESRGY